MIMNTGHLHPIGGDKCIFGHESKYLRRAKVILIVLLVVLHYLKVINWRKIVHVQEEIMNVIIIMSEMSMITPVN